MPGAPLDRNIGGYDLRTASGAGSWRFAARARNVSWLLKAFFLSKFGSRTYFPSGGHVPRLGLILQVGCPESHRGSVSTSVLIAAPGKSTSTRRFRLRGIRSALPR